MKMYSWIILSGAAAAVFLALAAYTGYMGYDINIHFSFAVAAILSGIVHVGLIIYQRRPRSR